MKLTIQGAKRNQALRWMGAVAVIGLLLAAGALAALGAANSSAAAPVASTAAGELTVMISNDPILGNILVDGAGKTLYQYANDTGGASTCTAACLSTWPPLVAGGPLTVGAGVDAALLGATLTTDNRVIITYKGRSLYTYKNDVNPGDANGNGVGGLWMVVMP